MRFRSSCAFVLAALGLSACTNDPFQPYGTDKAAAQATAETPLVLTYDPNVRVKTEEESWPVAWAQMQPRRVIEP